jgi:hypothetical protein
MNTTNFFYRLNGYANDLRYYNRVLSDAEISSLYTYTYENDYVDTFLGNNTSTSTSVSIPGLKSGTTYVVSLYGAISQGLQSSTVTISGNTI